MNMKRPCGLFLLVLFLFGPLQPSVALYCVTDDDCFESRYVSGTCTSNLCDCKEGSSPFDYGCFHNVPVIADSSSSGEVEIGTKIGINCRINHSLLTVAHKWKFNGIGQTSGTSYYFLWDIPDSDKIGNISCSFSYRGYQSPDSEPFTLTKMQHKTISIKPVVKHMPLTAIQHEKITVTCQNYPKSNLPLKYRFIIDGLESVWSDNNALSFEFEANSANNVSCQVRVDDGPPIESLPVDYPKRMDDITPTVTGPTFVLHGSESPIFLCNGHYGKSIYGISVEYSWDNLEETRKFATYTNLPGQPSSAGYIRCNITFTDSGRVVSSEKHKVQNVFADVKLVAKSSVIVGNETVVLECQAAGLEGVPFKYVWIINTLPEISDFEEDYMLQFNGLEGTTEFACGIRIDDNPIFKPEGSRITIEYLKDISTYKPVITSKTWPENHNYSDSEEDTLLW